MKLFVSKSQLVLFFTPAALTHHCLEPDKGQFFGLTAYSHEKDLCYIHMSYHRYVAKFGQRVHENPNVVVHAFAFYNISTRQREYASVQAG